MNGAGKVVVVDVNMKYFAVVGDNLMKFANDNKLKEYCKWICKRYCYNKRF